MEGGEITCSGCLIFIYSDREQRAPQQGCHSSSIKMLDCVPWAGYDFIYFLLIGLMRFFLKDISFVCLLFPSVPSKPSAFTTLPVTCVFFIVFLSLYFSFDRLRMKMSACQWVAVEA